MLLSDATFAGLTFHQDTANATTDSQLSTLFSQGTSAPVTTVTITGSMNGFSQSVHGTLSITATSANTFTIAASNLSLSLPNNLVTLSNSNASLSLTSSGFSGNISTTGSIAISLAGASLSAQSLTLAWDTQSGSDNNVTIGMAGSLTVNSGQSISNGTFSFEQNGSNVSVSVGASEINLNDVVDISNMAGNLTISTAGIQGSGTATVASTFTSYGAAFSGTFGFSVDTTSSSDPNLQLTGTGIHLTVNNTQVTADMLLEQVSGSNGMVGASLSNVTVDFTDGTNQFVTLSSPSSGSGATAAFFFESDSFVGMIQGTLTVSAPGVSASGEAVLQVNSGNNVFSLPDPLDNSNSLTIPAGPLVEVYARGLDLNFNGLTLHGDFGFSLTQDGNGNNVVAVSAADAGGSFGSTTIANASGSLVITAGTGGVSALTGSVTGDAAFSSGGGSLNSGSFTVTFDSSGNYSIAGTNVNLTVLGQTFTGSFGIDAQSNSTTFTLTDASLLFANELVTVTNLTGTVTIDGSGQVTGNVSGTLNTGIGHAVISGSVAVVFGSSVMTLVGTNDLVTVGEESISGDFSVTETGTGSSAAAVITASDVNVSLGNGLVMVTGGSLNLTVDSGNVTGSVSGNVSAGNALTGVSFSGGLSVKIGADAISASGTNDTLTINGTSFSAGFEFFEDSEGLELGISGVSLSIGNGALSVSNAAGTLLVPADGSGVSGSFSAGFASNVAGFTGNLAVEFDGSSFTLDATDVHFAVGADTISGDMQITQNGSELDLAATNLTASLAGGLVTIAPPASGSASSTLKLANGEFSGTFTGVVTAGSVTGASFSGAMSVSIDPVTGVDVTGTNDTLTIAGQSVTADFAFQEVNGDLHLQISNLNFSLGSVLAIRNASGDLVITGAGVTGSAAGTISTSIANFTGDLAVAFAPDSLAISGTNDRISFGDQYLAGGFEFTQDSSGIHVTASNLSASLGGGLVTVTNGSGSLSIDGATSAVSGAFSGTLATGGVLAAAGVGFGGTVSVAVANGVITASGSNDTLTLPGVSLSCSFDFFEDVKGLELSIHGLNMSLGGALSVVGASGTLLVNASGVSGFAAGTISSSLAGLSGTLGVTFGGGTIQVTGTNDKLTVGDQYISGDFAFTLNPDSSLTLDITDLRASLGGGLVTVGGVPGSSSGASGSLLVSGGNVSGSFSGYLSAGSSSAAIFGGQVAVTVDSSAITVAGTGDTLTIAGQTITGDFTFAEDLGSGDLDVAIANMSVALGGIIRMENVQGNVQVTSDGATGSLSGTLVQSPVGLTASNVGVTFAPGSLAIAATGATLAIAGQTLSGDMSFLDDASGLHLASSNMTAILGSGLVMVSGGSANLDIVDGQISGSFAGNVSTGGALAATGVGFAGVISVNVTPSGITATGTGDTLTVGGFQLSTDFNFVKDATGLKLNVSNLSLSLGSALSIDNASGQLLVTADGVTGSARGTIAANLPGVTLTGSLAIAFGGGTVQISGTNDALVIGGQSISGDFTFTQSAGGVSLTATNFSASLGSGLVTVSQGTGTLSIADGQFSGSFTGNLNAGTVGGGVSFSGPISVAVTNSSISAATPSGGHDTLSIGGQQVSAAFNFYSDAAGLELRVADMTASLGGVLTLTDGGGTLLVNSGGISGTATGALSSSFNGFSFSGTLGATFAPNLFELSGTNDQLVVGDQTLSGNFTFLKDSSGVHLTGSNFTISLGGGLVNVSNGSGTLAIANGNVNGTIAGSVSAGSGVSGVGFSGGITVTIAPGRITAATLPGQPARLTVGSTSLSAAFAFAEDASGLELALSNVNFSIGSGIVAVNNASGTVRVSRSGLAGAIQGGLSANVPGVTFGASSFNIAFAPGTLAIGGTGVSLTVAGQQLAGNFQFAQSNGTVSLAISNLSLSIGGIVSVTDGTGSFLLNSVTGITGSASGNVAIAGLSNVAFGGAFAVTVGNDAVSVSGTGDTLTLFGQTISGDFAFSQVNGNVNLHVASLSLSLGNGLVLVSGGAADFSVTTAGVAGTASGTLSVGSDESGLGLSGAVMVSTSSTGVSVTGTNIHLVLGGETLTASASFTRDSSTGLLDVAISNLKLSNPDVTMSGTLTVMPTGLSGTLTGQGTYNGVTGTITASFGNGSFSLTAGVSSAFSENLGPVAISGQIAAQGSTNGTATLSLTDLLVSLGNGLMTISGGSATLDYVNSKLQGTVSGFASLNGVPGLSVSGNVAVTFTQSGITVVGTDDSITILGQTLSGNFTFVDNGNGTVDLSISNLSVSLGNTVSLTGGTADFTLSNSGTSTGTKGSGAGNLTLSVPGLNFASQFGLQIDTTGGNSTFTIAANPMTLTIGGTSLTGSFALQKATLADGTSQMSLAASNVSMFLGDGSTGVQLADAGGTILILPTGIAMDIYGAASLVGVSGLTLGGTLHVRVNSTGSAVNTTVSAPDIAHPGQTTSQTLVLATGEKDVSGTATLAIGAASGTQFVSLSGGFSFSEVASTTGSITTTKLLIGAAGLEAFLGVGPARNADGTLNSAASGIYIQNANLGLVVFSTKDSAHPGSNSSSYALNAAGAASLLGIPGLTLSGTLAVQSNTAGAVNEEVDVPDPKNPGETIPVAVAFIGNTQAFAGNATLAIANPTDLSQQFLSLSGNFGFTRTVSGSTTTLQVTGQNIAAFVGVGGTTPVGLQLSNGSLGLTMIEQGTSGMTYALGASGTVSIAGIPGLYAGGTLSVALNTTGAPQTNPVDPTQTIAAGAANMQVQALTFAILDTSNTPVLSISTDATIQKVGSVVDINATNAEFSLTVAGNQLIDVQGQAEFTIGADGFKLGENGYQITSYSILGSSLSAANASGSGAAQSGSSSNGSSSSTGSNGTLASLPMPTGTPRKLGPLSLYNLQPIFKNFSFSGGQLSASIGLSADAAVLTFGGSGNSNGSNAGGTTAILSNVSGALNVALGIDLSAFRVTSFGSNGKFSFQAGEFVLNVPNVVNVDAKNILIQYDPTAGSTQKILSIGSATVLVPIGEGGQSGIRGQLSSTTDQNGNVLPGLVVYGDHFQLGEGTITYVGTLAFGSAVKFINPFVSISDLSASFDGSLNFDGSISIGAGNVILGPSSFQLTGSAVTATLTHTNGSWGFNFTAGTVGLKIGSTLNVTATNVAFNPTATGSDPLIALSSLQVTASLSKLTLTGIAGSNAGQIVISGDGSFSLPHNFSVGMTISAGTSGELGWPSWVPIQISSILLTWPDFGADASNFTLTFSANVHGEIGPIQIEGDLEDVTIDIGKLTSGQFPITGIGSAAISATGNVFGGTIDGKLILGVIKVDSMGHRLAPTATTYDHTLFYAGVEAGFTMPELGGADIRFGLTQNGPLEAYLQINADVMLIAPADIAIKSLYGGVTFDATPFPTISNARDLKNPVFTPGTQLSLEQWELQLQQEAANQAGAGGGGYLFTVTGASADAAALDAGTISDHLLSTFTDNGDVLTTNSLNPGAKKATVYVETPGLEWLILDGANYYLVTKDLTGNLAVSKYRFVIDPNAIGSKGTVASIAQLTGDLNSGLLTSRIISAFAAYGITLPQGATISANAPTPGQPVSSWTVATGDYKYTIAEDANGLLTVESQGGSMSMLNGVIRIEAAVTLGFYGVPTSEFSATGDIIIETDGKVLLNAWVNFGSQSGSGGADEGFNFRAFIDMSHASEGSVTTLFYFEQDVSVPDVGVMPQIVIAAGAQFARTDADNNLIIPGGANADATPVGFGVLLTGEIVYSYMPDATITLDGQTQLTFTATQASLEFNASLSASIGNFLQANNVVNAAGSFTVQYAGDLEVWGAAELSFDSGSIPFLQSAGISADAIVFLRINTDPNNDHTINFLIPTSGQAGHYTAETFDLQPASFGLYLVGQLNFDKGPISFDIDGLFDVDFKRVGSDWNFDIFAFGELDLGIAGQNILTMHAIGMIEVSNDGFAAMLAIDTSADGSILHFNFDFALWVNTTGHSVSYTLPEDLTAILQQMNGAVPSGGSSLLTNLEAELARLADHYGASNGGLAVANAGTLTITVPAGMPLLQQDGTVHGFAAPGPYLVIQGAGDLNVLNVFTINGSFLIKASDDGVSLAGQGQLHMGPLVGIYAVGSIDITSAGLVAAISLASNIDIGGVASFAGAATLEVNTTGQDQEVKEYTFDPGSGTISNTPSTVTIAGTTWAQIYIAGDLKLAGFFNLEGQFSLSLVHGTEYGDALTVTVDAHLDAFFGITLNVEGAARIYTGTSDTGAGLVLSITVSAGLNLASIITINGGVTLTINTFDHAMDLPDPANPLNGTISVQNGVALTLAADVSVLSVLSFHATGAITYDNVTRVFTLSFNVNESINLFIFNQNFEIGGWIDSTGQFAVTIYGDFHFGVGGIASLDGYGHLSLAYTIGAPQFQGAGGNFMPIVPSTPTVSGHRVLTIGGGAELSGEIFGITLASISVNFLVDSNLDLSFNITVHLNFFLFSINISFTINVGSFGGNKPPSVYLGGTTTNHQVDPGSFGGGTLVLNMGNLASYRNYDSSDTDEQVVIAGGNDYNPATGGQTIYVTLDGYTQAFHNVSKVVAPGNGGNNIQILNTVHVPVYASGGAAGRNATIVDAGTGGGMLTGGSGDDLLESGSGFDTINGGGGSDTIVVGTGGASVNTTGPNAGYNRILWNSDTSGPLNVTGAGNGDELVVTADTPGTAYAGGEKLTVTNGAALGTGKVIHTLSNGSTSIAYFANVPNLLISAPGGGNTLALDNLAATGLTGLSISYGSAHSSGNTVTVTSSAASDQFTLSSSTGTLPTIPTPQPASFGTGSSMALPMFGASIPNQVGIVDLTQGNIQINLFGAASSSGDALAINSAGGNDTFYVQSVIIPTSVEGNDPAKASSSDTIWYYVGYQGASQPGTLENINALFTVTGTAGTDVVVLDDSAETSNVNLTMTDTQVASNAFGTQGRLVYNSSIDDMNFLAGAGQNDYNIQAAGGSVHTQINTGSSDNHFSINAPLVAPLAINGNSSTFGGDTLTVSGTQGDDTFLITPTAILGAGAPIYYTNLEYVTINGNGGNDAFTLNGNTVAMTLQGGAGNDTFVINATTRNTLINGGDGTDSFTINGNGAPLAITGNNANDSFTVNGNSSQLTLNAGTGSNTFTVVSNAGVLLLNGGSGKSAFNAFNILGNTGSLTVNTNTGASSFTIANISAALTINSTGASSTFNITAPLYAPVTILGGTNPQKLTLNATAGNDNLTVTATAITGLGSAINYSGSFAITINGNGGNDTFTLNGNTGATTINAGQGNSTFNIRSAANAVTLNTGIGSSIITLGQPQTTGKNLLAPITGAVTVNGSGSDTLTVNDVADTLAQAGTLSASTLTGLLAGGLSYSGIAALNLLLGAGADLLNVLATSPATLVSINTGAGNDQININSTAGTLALNTGTGTNTINVGNKAPASGSTISQIQGPLTISGSGTDSLNVDDTADFNPGSVDLTATTLKGLGMTDAGITYTGLAALNLALGTGGNTVLVESTPANSATQITGGTGGDTFNVHSTAGSLNIHTGAGTNAINLGSTAPAPGGLLDNLHGAITVTGGGADTLSIDDTASTSAKSGALSAASLTGFGTAGITYSSIETLDVTLGRGDTTMTLNGTAAGTTTALATGSGNDTLNVLATGPDLTTIQTNAGNDTVNVTATTGTTAISLGTGNNVLTAGGSAQTLANIHGALSVTGGGSDNITLDDSANASAATGTLSASQLTGFSPAPITFNDSALRALTLLLGSGGNTLTVANTPATASSAINTGGGNDTVILLNTSGKTSVNTAGGNDAVRVEATSAATTVNTGSGADTLVVASAVPDTLDGIQGTLTLQGDAADTLILDDSGSHIARAGTLSDADLSGFNTAGIHYTGFGTFALDLGNGGATLTVANTAPATSTAINASSGNDIFTLANTSGITHLNVGTGNSTVTAQGISAATTISTASGGADAITVGNLGNTDALQATLTIAGNGTDTLNVDDSANTSAKAGTLTSVAITGLSAGSISYAGLASLAISLGAGNDTFAVSSTNAITPTSLNTGAGDDNVNISSTSGTLALNAGAGNNAVSVRGAGAAVAITSAATARDAITLGMAGRLSGIAAPIAISGNGATTLTLDDTADAAAVTGTLTADTLTGFTSAPVSYAGLASLAVNLGSGDDSVTLADTAANTVTSINTGAGNDSITLSENSGETTLLPGAGANTVHILATAANTFLISSGGTTTVTLGNNHHLSGIAGTVTIAGNGHDALLLDDTADFAATNSTLAASAVTGLAPAAINYAGLASLEVDFGSGNDILSVTGTSATSTTLNTAGGNDAVSIHSTSNPLAVNLGAGADSVNINNALPSDVHALGGALTITGNGHARLSVDDSGDSLARAVTLTASTITGLTPAPITYTGLMTTILSLGAADDSLAVTSLTPSTAAFIDGGAGNNIATLSFNSDFNSLLSLHHFATSSLSVQGNLNGSISTDGNVSSVSVTGNVASAATLDTTGTVSRLSVGGNQSGGLTAGTTGTMTLGGLLPNAAGVVWSSTDNGITRTLSVLSADGSPVTGVSFTVFYDNSTGGTPQIAIRANDSNPAGPRFDLLLSTTGNGAIDLARLDSTGDSESRIRNVVVDGDLLRTLTPSETAAMNYPADAIGGIDLPNDALAAVSVRDDLYAQSISARSFQGIAFSRYIDINNVPHAAASIQNDATWIRFASVINSGVNQTSTPVALPSEPLLVAIGSNGDELFTADTRGNRNGLISANHFSHDGLLLATAAPQATALATVSFRTDASHHELVVSALALTGDAVNISTSERVENIATSGTLGNVFIAAGKRESLQSLSAAEIAGSIDLSSGTLAGTLQSTAGDIGALSGTTLHLAMGPGAAIIAAGNIVSSIVLNGSLNGGLIAADGDIGAFVRDAAGNILATIGGISARPGKNTSGDIVAFGNILAPISLAAAFGGHIAAHGTPIVGFGQTGILGSLQLRSLLPTAAIVSGGEIGDASLGTSFSGALVKGLLLAEENISVSKPKLTRAVASHIFSNGAQGTPEGPFLATLWIDNQGNPLTFSDLPVLLSHLNGLAVSSGAQRHAHGRAAKHH